MWGRLVFTDYKTGCLRKILIQSRGTESKIDPKYVTVGALNEQLHEERLRSQRLTYHREFEFKTPVAQQNSDNTSPVTLSGHVDFVHTNADGVPVSIDELKSISSVNSYRKIIKNGQYLTENLAQIIAYMVNVRVVKGRLIYTYYGDIVDKGWTAIDSRTFLVEIDDFGRIHVDGKHTRWTVGDQLAHRTAAARVIATGEVAERPNLWDAPFVSPCGYCPFRDACDRYDRNEIEGSDAFVSYAQSLLSKE